MQLFGWIKSPLSVGLGVAVLLWFATSLYISDQYNRPFDDLSLSELEPAAANATRHVTLQPVPRYDARNLTEPLPVVPPKRRGRGGGPLKALIFTMDSTWQRLEEARNGGAQGEIIIRECLTLALQKLGVEVDTADSDAQFFQMAEKIDEYSFVLLDPWTVFAPGYVPRAFLVGREEDTFILDFFGSDDLGHDLKVDPKQYLTAFPIHPANTFLGFYFRQELAPVNETAKKDQGVVWAKRVEWVNERSALINLVADQGPLHLTTHLPPSISHKNIVHHGHVSRTEWFSMLGESKFLIGMGDPLAGPSALDAVMMGAMFINPKYKQPVRPYYPSQHPYMEKIGVPYVCTVDLDDLAAVEVCLKRAMRKNLAPLKMPDFQMEGHLQRVREIFSRYLA